jgi:hypothetical protein
MLEFGLVLVAICLVLLLITYAMARSDKKALTSLRSRLVAKHGEPTLEFWSNADQFHSSAFVFEREKLLVISGREFNFDSISDFYINSGESYNSGDRPAENLRNAKFHDIERLMNAASALKNRVYAIGYNIYVMTHGSSVPALRYFTGDDDCAQKFMYVLKIIIGRNKKNAINPA